MNMKNVDRGILPGRRSIKTDHTPMIYVCATMWHETTKEMIQILTSLFRCNLKLSLYTLLYCRHDWRQYNSGQVPKLVKLIFFKERKIVLKHFKQNVVCLGPFNDVLLLFLDLTMISVQGKMRRSSLMSWIPITMSLRRMCFLTTHLSPMMRMNTFIASTVL